MKDKSLNKREKEVKTIPVMIKMYCNHHHKTKKGELCEECKKLNDYSLYRLNKCPFKYNKKFCNFCKVHCYQAEMREKIKEVMKFSGPRMIFTHPLFAISHLFQKIRSKSKS